MTAELLRMSIRAEHDVFVARQRGREVAAALGMDRLDQVRVATALSDIGRQLLVETRGAEVVFSAGLGPEPVLRIRIHPVAPGLDLSGDGLVAARRLLDTVEEAGGVVVLSRGLPQSVLFSYEFAERVRDELERSQPASPLDELTEQNRQLINTLEEVQRQRDDLLQLNAELTATNEGVVALYTELSEEMEQTNQGVVALYAELDDRSAQLRETGAAKSRFLANVSHELRAPVTAIIGLTRLLLDAQSDPLTAEQAEQVRLAQTSAEDLLTLVSDLLDLAKAESARIEPTWAEVQLRALFGQLRGMLRPMARPGVELVIEEPANVGTIVSDGTLLNHILRNLLTNGLKFTERGEVRLRAANRDDGGIDLVVSDTGIGIPPEEQELIFEEFHQVANPLQAGVTGTGLGLSYARRLAQLLGGVLGVRSSEGGSVFTVTLPPGPPGTAPEPLPAVGRVLVVDDDRAFRKVLRGILAPAAGAIYEAADGRSALAIARNHLPDVVFMDVRMPVMDGVQTLAAFASDDRLRAVPVVMVTGINVTDVGSDAMEHAVLVVDKAEVSRGVIGTVLRTVLTVGGP